VRRSPRDVGEDLRAFARMIRRWDRAELEAEVVKRELIEHGMDVCYPSKKAFVNMIINDEAIERRKRKE